MLRARDEDDVSQNVREFFIRWAAKQREKKLMESFQIEPATTCGECLGYRFGKDLPRNEVDVEKGQYWRPGSCEIEDVSDELPYDAVPPDWCPLRKNPVLIVLEKKDESSDR
jgi:hypothetical protein